MTEQVIVIYQEMRPRMEVITHLLTNEKSDDLARQRVFVFQVPKVNCSDVHLLEMVWVLMNRVESEPGTRHLDTLCARSLQTGDLVVARGAVWQCRDTGWWPVSELILLGQESLALADKILRSEPGSDDAETQES